MTMDRLIGVLVAVLLIQMMATVGLRVSFGELGGIVKNWRLLLRAVLANYVVVPAAAVALVLLFHAQPMVATGFLILAVCPGAPFGPPCTALARGNVSIAVGVMALLAVTSAIVAPVLLRLLTPLVAGSESLEVDAARIFGNLLVMQLLPLAVGLCIRHWMPGVAERLQKPAERLTGLLSLVTVGAILWVHFHVLLEMRPRGYAGMTALLAASWLAGWLFGGANWDECKAMVLTTGLRNVGVGLVIATTSFPGTGAVTATLAYGLFEIFGCLLLAYWWGRRENSTSDSSGAPMAQRSS